MKIFVILLFLYQSKFFQIKIAALLYTSQNRECNNNNLSIHATYANVTAQDHITKLNSIYELFK